MNLDIKKVKIITTIPVEKVTAVRDAICKAGAGIIGNYTFCTMSTKCTGTFIPNESANPYIGKNGKMEYVEEEKLEAVCEIEKVKAVVSALREAHPYEEPEVDIIPLLDENDF